MDKEQLTQIYEENAKIVYKYLFCLTNDSYLAEEITQETFYQAAKGLDKFRGECKISVWLCQIGKRIWYKELQKQKKEILSLEDVIDIKAAQNIEEEYLLNVEKIELFRQLHNLDEKTREVMYLRLTGELSFAEIGDILQKTENWARVTFYRGKQKIGRRKVEER